LQRWEARLKETGTIEVKKRNSTWRKIEPTRLLKFLEKRPGAYLIEIAEEFGCSDVAVLKHVNDLKIQCKKTTQYKEIDDTTDSVLFEFWFENHLLKEVDKGTTIILDNATFHKKFVLAGLAKAHGCEVLYFNRLIPPI